MTQYALPGSKKYQEQLYPSPCDLDLNLRTKFETYKDVITHFTASSLAEDGIQIEPGSLRVTESATGYTVRFKPKPDFATQAEHFKKMHMEILDESHAGLALRGVKACQQTPAWNPMSGYPVNRSDGPSEWKLCLPLGMPMANHRAVTLLHYPPIIAYKNADYLNNNTLRRWAQLLRCVGIDQPKLYHAIIDVNPIAAPGSGQSEYPNDYFPINLTSLFFDNDKEGLTYLRSMLELMLNPPANAANRYTLPLLVCGSPLYDPHAPGWFRTRYKDQLPKDRDGKPMSDVLQAGLIKINPDSSKLTPYLIANHMIAAGVTGSCSNDPSKIPNIQKYEAQDLVAASFLGMYAESKEICPDEATQQACLRWFGAPDGSVAPNPPADEDRLTICALAQWDKCFDKEKREPTYTYQEAVARCQQKGGLDYSPCFGCVPLPAENGFPWEDTLGGEDALGGLRPAHGDYLICRSTDAPDYSIWRVDMDCEPLRLQRLPSQKDAKFDPTHQLISIGNYILEWGPAVLKDYAPYFPYRLFKFDPSNRNPLAVEALKKGAWEKKKFWGRRPDFGNPEGAAKAYDSGEKLILVPLGTFVLNVIPTTGRGTFKLFNFDPGSADPLTAFPTHIKGSFDAIQFGHELIAVGNYVLDWVPSERKYRLWSFDPMDEIPLTQPFIQEGYWDDIDENHQLIPIGEHVFDWDMKQHRYRLWRFDPASRNPESKNPLAGPLKEGQMPPEFEARMTVEGIKGNILTGIQGLRPVDQVRKYEPGTIDFMRTNIKHVVYYMIENCSFDHVCGWLYEKGEQNINFVPPDCDKRFKGCKHAQELGCDYNFNHDDLDSDGNPKKVYLEKFDYTGGTLESQHTDPYHDVTDTLRQMFYLDQDGYKNGKTPTMGGFVWNNGVKEVMLAYTPEQLPVLNGLAKAFAVSDEWFSSTTGATDAQRAFALTGSSLRQLDNFMDGPQYTHWPDSPHRASIWKVLWANGFTDWKIYNSVMWPPPEKGIPFVLSYHLFLKGQIESVDAKREKYIANLDQFMEDAKKGSLPTFSFLEPVWIASQKPATSYHPSGEDGKTHGEKALNEIYEALKSGPKWNETLLIITFDEHGGLFDHIPPPRTRNPWPNDEVCGFKFDILGVRVPTILVSPWIEEQTVFRSPASEAHDATSILATLLRWHGIPKARWGLGERTHHAPTFEGVFQRTSPRSDAPSLPSPPSGEALLPIHRTERVRSLHQQTAWRMVNYIASRKVKTSEACRIADDILARATDVSDLHRMMDDLLKRMG